MTPSSLSGCKILLIDDDDDNRDLLAFVLEARQAQVTAVGTPDEVITTLSQRAFDVYISDIAMPYEDGYSLLRRVRALEYGKQIPAIALTAFAKEEDHHQAIAAGFQTYLAKPIDPDRVVSAVIAIVQK